MRTYVKDGAYNETIILNALNKHYYKDIDPKWQRHLKRMFKKIKPEDYIRASYYEYDDGKPDIIIDVNGQKRYLSIKSGHAPAMHSEPIKTFFNFLRTLDVPERLIKIIAFYHYGFSLKKGVTKKVLTKEEIIEQYSPYIKEVNDYFSLHKEILREFVYRFILRGRMKRDLIDYFYYGNSARGFLLSTYDILSLVVETPNKECKAICFNGLVYSPCARNLNSPKKNRIKISWPILCVYFYDKEFMKKYG